MHAETISYQNTSYLKSVANLDQLPRDEGAEVAFIGYSNAGKSSALNMITSIKGLARTSKTPGRTQMINFFTVCSHKRLVDLPGYGYAKVPLSVKERWMKNVDDYLHVRKSLHGLVIAMDVRHPLKELDQQVIAWAVSCGVPTHILLTKADKLKSAMQRQALQDIRDALAHYGAAVSVQLFSSIDRIGVEEAREKLTEWLCHEEVCF